MTDPGDLVEPLPGEPAAVADCGDDRALVVADFHAGIESWMREERGVSLDSDAAARRETVRALAAAEGVDRVVFLGDLAHFYGGPHGAERGEIEVLLEDLVDRYAVTVVKGNHDGGIEEAVPAGVAVTDPAGVRLGEVGLVHGHTWPDPAVLAATVVCVGHEHPCVRIEDRVGGSRVESAWLRGAMAREPFADREAYADLDWADPELVVFPAFNDLAGCHWVNVAGREFLSPFLPAGLADGEVYLLDGTRLGDYRAV